MWTEVLNHIGRECEAAYQELQKLPSSGWDESLELDSGDAASLTKKNQCFSAEFHHQPESTLWRRVAGGNAELVAGVARLRRNHNSLDPRWPSPGSDNEGYATDQAPPFRPPLAPKWLFHFSNNHTAAVANEGADYRRRGSRGETKSSETQNKVVIFFVLIKSVRWLKYQFESNRGVKQDFWKDLINMLMWLRRVTLRTALGGPYHLSIWVQSDLCYDQMRRS